MGSRTHGYASWLELWLWLSFCFESQLLQLSSIGLRWLGLAQGAMGWLMQSLRFGLVLLCFAVAWVSFALSYRAMPGVPLLFVLP